MYRQMHEHGDQILNISAEKIFAGRSLLKHVERIKTIINILGSKTILDYGAGKGKQYEPRSIKLSNGKKYPDIPTYWGVERVTCYDPAFPPYSTLPNGKFDGVICTDVLEHCPEQDIPWIIEELFSFAREFVFVDAVCIPSKKRLPNGENAHCTIRPPNWWKAKLDAAVADHPGLRFFALVDTIENSQIRKTLIRGKSSPAPTAVRPE
jgi:hypothetical protein